MANIILPKAPELIKIANSVASDIFFDTANDNEPLQVDTTTLDSIYGNQIYIDTLLDKNLLFFKDVIGSECSTLLENYINYTPPATAFEVYRSTDGDITVTFRGTTGTTVSVEYGNGDSETLDLYSYNDTVAARTVSGEGNRWIRITSGFENLIQLRFESKYYYNEINNLTAISLMTNLSQIWIWNNNLSGDFPDITNLTNLTQIYAIDNNFTGNLPNINNSMTALTNVRLNNNEFTGCNWTSYPVSCTDFQIIGVTLTQDALNTVAIRIDESGLSTGSVVLTVAGGLVPTGDGATAVSNLIGRGVTVTTN